MLRMNVCVFSTQLFLPSVLAVFMDIPSPGRTVAVTLELLPAFIISHSAEAVKLKKERDSKGMWRLCRPYYGQDSPGHKHSALDYGTC